MKFICTLFLFFYTCSWQAQTTLLQTDFQSGIPSNYTLLNLDNQAPAPGFEPYASGWIIATDPENALDTVAAASSYFLNADTANRWLITPALTLGSFGNYLSWEAKSHDPSFPDDYLVLLSHTTNDPSAFTDTIGSVQEENFEWTCRTVNLSQEGYNDSTIYIAFVLRGIDNYILYLDDIKVLKDDPVGLAELPIFNLVVYPNPSSDLISVQNIKGVSKLEILDFNGKVLLHSFQSSISITELLSGSYLLRCTTPSGQYTTPIYKI